MYQLLEIRGSGDLSPIGLSEYEVSEVHLVDHELLNPVIELRILLVQEADPESFGLFLELKIFRLEQNR